MQDRQRGEPRPNSEIVINPQVVNALRGESQEVEVRTESDTWERIRLIKEGPQMFGITDWRESRLRSTLLNHELLCGRFAGDFSKRLAEMGYDTDPSRIVNAHVVSHAGRWQWDEARMYPDAVKALVGIEEYQSRVAVSNETLGLKLIQGKVPSEVFDLVAALAHEVEGFEVDPAVYESLDYKLAIYVDHRTTQQYEPLNKRMGDFLLGNFFAGREITPRLREDVYEAVGSIIGMEKRHGLNHIDDADAVAATLGASETSNRLPRRELMRLILQDASTEAFLEQHGIDPNTVLSDVPEWEDKLRRDYVESAGVSLREEAKKRMKGNYSVRSEDLLDAFMPSGLWWNYAWNLLS